MRKLLFLPLLMLLLWHPPSYADSTQDAEFERGMKAYSIGRYSEAFKILKPLAESGHGPAQYWLGASYKLGYGVAKDKSEAEKWYRKAFESFKPLAESGDAIAQYWLGALYEYGHGVTKDESEAKKWYRKAAKQGYAKAQYHLGRLYYGDGGVVKDGREAFKWYLKAAKQGYARAQFGIARLYYRGNGVAEDKNKSKKWYRKAFESWKILAESGDLEAQHFVAYYYKRSIGVAYDARESFKWYLKAAKQGHTTAQSQVAYRYKEGKGVTKSLIDAYFWFYLDGASLDYAEKNVEEQLSPEQLQQAKAKLAKWILKKAEQGFRREQYIFGKIYEEGIGVPESLVDAYIWYTVAKLSGDAGSGKRAEAIEEKLIPAEIQQAKAKVKQCIESNYKNCSWKTASDSNIDTKFKRGIEAYDAEDYRKAFQIWKDSAESGHVKSQYYLGIMYYEGKGTIRNYKKAHLWYYNAAKQGHVAAQSKLGTMYSEGKGVPQDSINAYMWYSIAAANGADSSSLDYLERILSPEQLDQALAKAERCLESDYQHCD